MVVMQGWCCVPYPCISLTTTVPASTFTIETSRTITVTSKTSQPTVPVTRSITNIRPDYSNWSCTENCGGCGIGCRTRTCLTTPFDCIDATLEFNNQSYNQHPCPFGKRTCCTNYRLG